MGRYQGLIGVVVLLAIAWLMSNNRRKISLRVVIWGLALQFTFAILILRTPVGYPFFRAVDGAVSQLLSYSYEGSKFLFKPLDSEEVSEFDVLDGDDPGVVTDSLRLKVKAGDDIAPVVRTFAFVVLPTIIFFSALLSVLYHLGVMQFLVKGIAWVMQKTMGTSGAETLSCAGNIFVGQTEAPLLVRPFLAGMTRSELLTVMCGGFATIAGGVMAMYVAMLVRQIPEIAGHLMAASVMSAPAALVMAKILYPETEKSQTAGTLQIEVERRSRNVLEAIGDGATDGMKLVLNIAAMLVAFLALVALLNGVLGLAGTSLQQVLGFVLRPLAWCLGAPWSEADTFGALLGEKLALTELLAYTHLSELKPEEQVSERTAVIASYALCGFANFASIGIQMGGIGALVPERKQDLAELALKAMIGGALASWMTAAIAGVLIDV
jgi:CNT family concentrative nucleoside transporter